MYSFFGNRSLRLKLPHEIHWHWQSLDRCFTSKQHSLAFVFSQHSLLDSLWSQHRHSAPNEYERDMRSQVTEKMNVIINKTCVGVFIKGSIKTGKVIEFVNGSYCVFKEDISGDKHTVNIKKLRKVIHNGS